MKDELEGKIMVKFVGLRSKLYAYELLDGKGGKRCKGTKKCVVKDMITFDDYKTCLDDGKEQYREQLLFRSKKHRMYTMNINKIALSRNDDKRVICDDGISTLARGHYKL